MNGRTPDAGLTMLELLIGLAIFAGLIAVGTSAAVPGSQQPDGRRQIAEFVAGARSDAILTGVSGVLGAVDGVLSYKATKLNLKDKAPAARQVRLLVYPDGTLAGDVEAFRGVTGVDITGVLR